MARLFSTIEMAPKDPILGISEAYQADIRPKKVNLGVGVYYNAYGKIPILDCVNEAEKIIAARQQPRSYLPIDGIQAYGQAVQKLLLGADSSLIEAGRAITVQALGGTGALKVGADFLKQLNPQACVSISDPSWENHRALFTQAGFLVENYPYYDATSHGVRFDALQDYCRQLAAGSILVLHACCHNPTGADLTIEQWQILANLVKEKQLVPFLDIAYQGFGEGLEQDAQVVRLFASLDIPCFIASSFSKSFSLYGERVGALTILTADRNESARLLSQVKRVIRTNYSNPPIHGATVVTQVLTDPDLYRSWDNELAGMRTRSKSMRHDLVSALHVSGVKKDFSFINQQSGMFSYSGLTLEQVLRLREEHAVYAIDSGRICIAALNQNNLSTVIKAIERVL